jgi:uncharacterized protein
MRNQFQQWPRPAVAAYYQKNSSTLVYSAAITKNEPGKVNIHPATYKLNSLDIVANVYTPANYGPLEEFFMPAMPR